MGSPANVGIGTTGPATKLDVLGSITVGANSYTTISNNEYDVSSGDLLFDVAGDITLDAGGSDIKLSKAGGNKASFYLTTSDVYFGTKASDGDFYITGSDGGSQVTALHFDMSEVGLATFSTTPVVGTMTSSDNSTKAASTAFVKAQSYGTGTIGGSITDNQVAIGASTANSIEGSANLTYDGTNLTLARTADNTSRGVSIQDNEGTETIRLGTSSGDHGLLYLRGATGGNAIYLDGGTGTNYLNAGDVAIGHTAALNGAKLTVLDATRPLVLAYDTTNYSSFDISTAGGLTITVPHSFVVDSSRHMDLDIGSVTREHRFLYAGTKYGYATTTDSNTFWTIASTSTPTAGMMLSGAAGSITLKPHDKDVDIYGAVQLVNGQVTSNPGTNHLWASGSTLFWGSSEIDTSADSGTIGGSVSDTYIPIATAANTLGNFMPAYVENTNMIMGVTPASITTDADGNTAYGHLAGQGITTGDSNVFVGYRTGKAVTTGVQNTFVGQGAGIDATTSSYNNFFGNLAGYSGTRGNQNNAFGYYAMSINQGTNNVAMGHNAMQGEVGAINNESIAIGAYALRNVSGTADMNTAVGHAAMQGAGTGITSAGQYNTALGNRAMSGLTGGYSNVAVGRDALTTITTGYDNTVVGALAGGTLTTGYYNTYIGKSAGSGATTTAHSNVGIGLSALSSAHGAGNVAIGRGALSNTTDANQVAIGYSALEANTSGEKNVAIGFQALEVNTTGSYNVAMGHEAMELNVGGYYNVAIGYEALATLAPNSTEGYNTALGYSAGSALTTGTFNTLIGGKAGDSLTTAQRNTMVGHNAGQALTTQSYNTMVGERSGENSSDGIYNTFLGYLAGYNNAHTTGRNTFIGSNAGQSANSQYQSVFIGQEAGYGAASSGYNNIVVGRQAGFSMTSALGNVWIGAAAGYAATTADKSVFIGDSAGKAITTQDGSVLIGYEAGRLQEVGSGGNVAVGHQALYSGTQNYQNVALGYNAGRKATGASANNVYLGSAAGPSSTGAESNKLYIHNAEGTPLIKGDFSADTVDINGDLSTIDSHKLKVVNASSDYWAIYNQANGKMRIDQGTTQKVLASSGEFQFANDIIVDNDLIIGTSATSNGARLHIQGDENLLANFQSTDGIAEIRIIDNTKYTRLLTVGSQYKIMPNDGVELMVLDGSANTVAVNGVISATAKSFNIPHPLYKDKRLVHGSLEGPEHAIYVRGTIETEEKGCLVELPEYWSAMCEDYTVQLTPHGPYTVYIKEKLKDKVMIECSQKKFKFDYYIVGARTDETLEVVQDG